jgi:hypothetical protein
MSVSDYRDKLSEVPVLKNPQNLGRCLQVGGGVLPEFPVSVLESTGVQWYSGHALHRINQSNRSSTAF